MDRGDPAGGSFRLAQLLRQYPAAIESDLLRVWGVDIYELYDDTTALNPARVLRLLATLGDESAYAAAYQGGPQFSGWGVDRLIQRRLLFATENTVAALVKLGGEKPPKVEPIGWPGERRKQYRRGQSMFAAMARQALGGDD